MAGCTCPERPRNLLRSPGLRAGGARNAHVLACTLRFLRSGDPQSAFARDDFKFASPMTDASFNIRPIEARDDAAVASIIRTVMPEFGADGPGFAIHDTEVGTMHAAY